MIVTPAVLASLDAIMEGPLDGPLGMPTSPASSAAVQSRYRISHESSSSARAPSITSSASCARPTSISILAKASRKSRDGISGGSPAPDDPPPARPLRRTPDD
eukprot:scaffold7435_cov84-Isochrysis_galbana.AAC.2